MMTKTALYRKITAEYDALRLQEENARRRRRAEAYEKQPRLEEIQSALEQSGLRAARLVLQNPAAAAAQAALLAEEAESLKTERALLLKRIGLPADYLDLRYRCPRCKDTGYENGAPCVCFRQRLISLAYDQSNLARSLATENFDYFNFRLYSDEEDPRFGISPRERIQQIFDRSIDFVENFPAPHEPVFNLLLYGDTGLGKTFLCSCIAKEILDKGHTVLYLTAAELCRMAENAQFRRGEEEDTAAEAMDDLADVELLIIDDLGTEFATALTASALFGLINRRLINRRPTLISTNLSLRDLRDRYSERVLSRLMGAYDFLEFFGEDIRCRVD